MTNGMKIEIQAIKRDVAVIMTDAGILKADVGALKTDVGMLKSDVGALKTDVEILKTDVTALRATTTKTAIEVSRIDSHVNGLATREEIARGFNEVISKLDSFAGEIEGSRRERKLHGETFNSLNDRLVDHELRLYRLESRGEEKKS